MIKQHALRNQIIKYYNFKRYNIEEQVLDNPEQFACFELNLIEYLCMVHNIIGNILIANTLWTESSGFLNTSEKI